MSLQGTIFTETPSLQNRVLKTTNTQAGRSTPIGEGWNAPNFTPTSTRCAIGVFLTSFFCSNQPLTGRGYDVGTA